MFVYPGFYLNECTDDVFSPRASESGGDQIFHSLVDLLNQISPLFRKNFAALTKKRVNKHPFERVATPYQGESSWEVWWTYVMYTKLEVTKKKGR